MGVGSEGENHISDGWCGGERGEVEQEYRNAEEVNAEEFESVWCFEFQ